MDGVEHWLGEKASSCWRPIRRRASPSCWAKPVMPSVSSRACPGRAAARRHRAHERSLNGGFVGGPDGLAVVTDRELFGSVRVRRPKAMRRIVPRDILERLTPGDMVVHIDHGIARYEQMLRRGGSGEERDYLELSFAAGDRIFVPVEQINRVSRYSGGENPTLSRLGGTDWLRTKQRVRKAVTDLADELLALYAKREAAEGFAYAVDSPWQMEMAPVPARGDADRCARRPRSRPTWRAAARWIAWSWATWATARREVALRGRVQGDPRRQAGGGARAHDRSWALHHVQPAVRGVPAQREAAEPVRVREGAGRDGRRLTAGPWTS
ncbi:MAG: CarD family transcriptional regulator [Chloroflexota bacterium]